ncbi:MAG: hypothetical protein MJ014_09010 [Methanocorpusculum sp.]|nr:hypothetical protein [Methanocorpusculum sp.]
MVINHVPRLACSTMFSGMGSVVVLEPLSKFPFIADLSVDRSCLYDSLKELKPQHQTSLISSMLSPPVSCAAAVWKTTAHCSKSLSCEVICPAYIQLAVTISRFNRRYLRQMFHR